MYNIDLNIFYNSNGVLNKNKLRETWVKKNLKDFYSKVLDFPFPNDLERFSQKMYHFINGMKNYPKCFYCKKENKRWISFKNGYKKCCSRSCSILLSRPKANEKRKENTIKKWGVSHTSKLDFVKEKRKKTNMKKWGGPSPSCNEEILEKMKGTNLKRIGVLFPIQNEKIKNKIKNTCIKKWGVDNSLKNKELLLKNVKNRVDKEIIKLKKKYNINIVEYKNSKYNILCELCGKKYSTNRDLLRSRIEVYNTNPCLNCNPLKSFSSKYEEELSNFLKENNINYKRNFRKYRKELDIFLPDYNLGIEINGLYWHSEIKKDKRYHLDKTNYFKSLGIKVWHIWEDEWLFKKKIVKNNILIKTNSLKNELVCKELEIKEVSNKKARKFLNKNHIKGFKKSKIKLGLFDKKEKIVSVLLIDETKNNYILNRFCDKLDYNIIDSEKNLFDFFISNYKKRNKNIISYSSLDCLDIKECFYNNLGFNFVENLPPNFHWVKNGIRYKNIRNNSYKIWDCGKSIFLYKKV